MVSTPLERKCSENPTIAVGVRFTKAARRVVYAQASSVSPSGRVLTTSQRFKNSRRWQFGTLRLTRGCGVLHEVHYSFHRKGDRTGQRLGDYVCVLGAKGEPCPVPSEGD